MNKQNPFTFRFDDFRLLKYEGNVEILDNDNEIIYRGEFKDGHCNGEGILYHEGFKYYEGKFVKDQMEDDAGKLFYKNGTLLYEGSFLKNERKGEGVSYYQNGTKKEEGIFLKGKLDGEGMTYDSQGALIYKGNFKGGKYHQEGTLLNRDGSLLYEGDFLQGEKHGEGKVYTKYGKLVYQGAMVHDQIDFAAYCGETLDQISPHFVSTPYIYVYQGKTAFAYKDLNVMFVTTSNIVFTQEILEGLSSEVSSRVNLISLNEKIEKENILCNKILFVEQVYDLWDEQNLIQKNVQNKVKIKKGNPIENKRKRNEEDVFVDLYLKRKGNEKVYDISYKKYSEWIYLVERYQEREVIEDLYKRYEQNQCYIYDNQRLLYSFIESTFQKAK